MFTSMHTCVHTVLREETVNLQREITPTDQDFLLQTLSFIHFAHTHTHAQQHMDQELMFSLEVITSEMTWNPPKDYIQYATKPEA